MPPVGFEPTISAGERSQTYALDRAATGTGAEILQTRTIFFFYDWRSLHWSLIRLGLESQPQTEPQ